MNRIRVPSGSVQKLETIFDNLQDSIELNINNRVDALIGTNNYGLLLDATNGTLDDSFQLFINFKANGFSINGGEAIVPDGEHFGFEGYIANNAFSSFALTAAKYYLVKISYVALDTESINSQNGFIYSKVGATYASQYTKKEDSYLVEMEEITTLSGISPATDELFIGVLKTNSGGTQFDKSVWALDSYTASGGVVDLRNTNRLVINTLLLDDSLILLKDRDSIGTRKLSGKLEISDDFYVNDTTLFVDSSMDTVGIGTAVPIKDLHIKSNNPQLLLHDSVATTLSGISGSIIWAKGDEADLTTWDDEAAYVGFLSKESAILSVSNETNGSLQLRVAARNETQQTKTYKYLTLTNQGYVGINKENPVYNLDVVGTAKFTDTAYMANITANDVTLSGTFNVTGDSAFTGTVTLEDFEVASKLNFDSLTGNLMLGNGSPTSSLHVKRSTAANIQIDSGVGYSPYIKFNIGEQNPSTFYVGINVADDAFRIDTVAKYTNNLFVLDTSGNLGLGVEVPTVALDIDGNVKISGEGHQKALRLIATGSGQKEYDLVVGTIPEGNLGDADDIGKGKFGIYDTQADQYRLVIDKTGNIGLGVNNPTYKLHVYGNVGVEGNVVISGNATATNSIITNLTVTNASITNLSFVSDLTGESATFTGLLDAVQYRWPSYPGEVYKQGGISASGWVTIGDSITKSYNTTEPDQLRVNKNVRIYGSGGSKLIFAPNTTSSGITFDYNSSLLDIHGEYGLYLQMLNKDGVTPTVNIPSLIAANIEVTNLNLLETALDVASVQTDRLYITGVVAAENSSASFVGNTFVQNLNIDYGEFTDLEGQQLTVSGQSTFKDVLLTGEFVSGDPITQRIELNGNTGTLEFYDPTNTRVILIDDDAVDGLPGITIDNGILYLYNSAATLVKLQPGFSTFQSGDYYRTLQVLNSEISATDSQAIYSHYRNNAAVITGDVKRIGIWGRTTLTNPTGGGTTPGDAIGVYGSATTAGTGNAYAGYFGDGILYIKGASYYDGIAYFGDYVLPNKVGIDTPKQRLEIDGHNGTLKFYDNANVNIILVDDDIDFGHGGGVRPGIKIIDGLLWFTSSITSSKSYLIPHRLHINSYGDENFALTSQINSVDPGMVSAAYSFYSTTSNSAHNAERRGVTGQSLIYNASNNDIVIGLYGDAYTQGIGHAYAGYFNQGDVYIANDLEVDGYVTVASGISVTGQGAGWSSVAVPSKDIDGMVSVDDVKKVLASLINDLKLIGLFSS